MSKSIGMSETMYRSSRYFRVLGNPTAYLILKSLEQSSSTPSQLAEELGKAITTISNTLRHMRQVDLVRYHADDRRKIYRIKDKGVLDLLDKGEKLAEKMRTLKE